MEDPYKLAASFAKSFGEAEYALKRSSHLRENKDVAEADWNSFARDLGPDFFAEVVERAIAKTLINEPPRRLMKNLRWAPKVPIPLANAQELIVQGVCRVRNSYLHGEKFTGGPDGQWARDLTLIREAHAVLEAAFTWLNRAKGE